MNLRGICAYRVSEQHSERTCPVCNCALDTITIEGIAGFAIERCGTCYGLFFDPEELPVLIAATVDNVYSVNMKTLWHLNQTAPLNERRKAYVACPVCRELMNRVNFGARSGVVVDQCKHGIWLDNGELRKLLEWRKAGGQLLHEQVVAEKAAREEKERERKERALLKESSLVFSSHVRGAHNGAILESESLAMLRKVATIIGKLFV